jgi:hypothetical protein
MLHRTSALLRLAPHRAGIALTIQAGGGLAIDSGLLAGDAANAANLALSAAATVLQFWVVRTLLQDLGHALPDRPRFPAFFVMMLATTIGVLVGCVALVVPGIILMVRWSIASPLVIGSGRPIFDAIGESWRATKKSFWAIFAVFALVYGAAALVAMAGAAVEFGLRTDPLVGLTLLNLGLVGGVTVGWYAAVAVYDCLRPGRDHLKQVFE